MQRRISSSTIHGAAQAHADIVAKEIGERRHSGGDVLRWNRTETIQLVLGGSAPDRCDNAFKVRLLGGDIPRGEQGATKHKPRSEQSFVIAAVRDKLRANGQAACTGTPAVC